MIKFKGYALGIEWPWSEDVRLYGAQIRAYIHTPKGMWIVGEKSQVYDRKTETYTDDFAYITWRPPNR